MSVYTVYDIYSASPRYRPTQRHGNKRWIEACTAGSHDGPSGICATHQMRVDTLFDDVEMSQRRLHAQQHDTDATLQIDTLAVGQRMVEEPVENDGKGCVDEVIVAINQGMAEQGKHGNIVGRLDQRDWRSRWFRAEKVLQRPARPYIGHVLGRHRVIEARVDGLWAMAVADHEAAHGAERLVEASVKGGVEQGWRVHMCRHQQRQPGGLPMLRAQNRKARLEFPRRRGRCVAGLLRSSDHVGGRRELC